MPAEYGEYIYTIVYILRETKESLLELDAGVALGIISINPEGQRKQENVGEIHKTIEKIVEEGQVVSGAKHDRR